jgi:hypothetical protein
VHRFTGPSILVTSAVLVAVVSVSGCTSQSKPPEKSPDQHGEHAHGSEISADPAAQLVLSSTPERPRAGDPALLRIMLHDASGQMLKEFEPTHTKLAHLIIVREGLDEFAHLHPTVDATGNMTAAHTFPSGGSYLVFLDHKPVGKPAATTQAKLVVEGDSPPPPALKPNVPGTIEGDGLQAKVSMRASADKSQVVSFQVQDTSGKPTNDLQPYLGAMGHLVVLSADGGQYVHAHPLTETAPDGNVEFEVHFPGPGTYKGWGQFQRGGKVFTIPAVMQVEGGAPHH